jgi:hypothetical protein
LGIPRPGSSEFAYGPYAGSGSAADVNAIHDYFARPFVIDLDSTNGTFVNDEQIPASR